MNSRSLLMVSGGLILTFLVMAGYAPSYSSNGERIYYIAAGSSRESISHSGSISMMHPIGCVNCYGTDGKGVDLAGEPLDEEMPRWNISQRIWTTLLSI